MSEGKKVSGGVIAAVVFGCGCGGVALLGVIAAVAIPAFLGYVNKSKVAEAETNLSALAVMLESYRIENGSYPQQGLPRTPLIPCSERQMWPLDADPGWAQIGFAPADPVYFSYEYEPGVGGTSYTVRAIGDLDCDGVTSLFERTDSSPSTYVENELE